jgi:hypothetical protein
MSGATFTIVDGPAAYEIWAQAEHSQNKNVKMPLKFTTTHAASAANQNDPHYLEPTITSVGHLDDSGQMLQVSGYTTYGDKGGRSRFTGFYDARTRKGSFIFGG